MSMVLGSLSEIATSLFQSLRLSYVVPAFVFWTLNAVFIFPSLPPEVREPVSHLMVQFKLEPITLISAFSLLGGYFLYVLNTTIIRWAEGYPWREWWLAVKKIEWHNHLKRELGCQYKERLEILLKEEESLERTRAEIEKKYNEDVKEMKLDDPKRNELYTRFYTRNEEVNAKLRNVRADVRKALLMKDLQIRYPTSRPAYLPTQLGNVIAAFEDYPQVQYNMDSVTLWPRLMPILSREKFTLFIEREKANLDFLLNMLLIMLLFGTELFLTGYFFAEDMSSWVIATGCSFIFSYFAFYKTSISSAAGWGHTVKVAFDLHRYDLLAALYGRHPSKFDEEKEIWSEFSSFYRQYGVDPSNIEFDYKRVLARLTQQPQDKAHQQPSQEKEPPQT